MPLATQSCHFASSLATQPVTLYLTQERPNSCKAKPGTCSNVSLRFVPFLSSCTNRARSRSRVFCFVLMHCTTQTTASTSPHWTSLVFVGLCWRSLACVGLCWPSWTCFG